MTQLCAHHGKVSSTFRCVDSFFCTKCLRNRVWNIFPFMGATQSRESTRNVLYSCKEALSPHGKLENASMAFYPCLSIPIISKIYKIWKWRRPQSLASVSSQLSFAWSCEINYMRQIPTADKFFSICFPIREKKCRITFMQQLHKQVISLKTKKKQVRIFSGLMPKIFTIKILWK